MRVNPLGSIHLIDVWQMQGEHLVITHLSSCFRYITLPPGSLGIYDPTEIRNRGMLARFQKEALVKIGYHVIVFFISLYG